MLQRDRQLRTQVHQLKDAALFGLALWVAHFLRDHAPEQFLGWNFPQIERFEDFVWIYLVIIPGVPLILESQGFYQRPLFASRRETAWMLFKSCMLAAIGVVLVIFLFRFQLARSVIVLFGFISFGFMLANEELLRVAYRSRFGQLQLKKRVLLVGTKEDTTRVLEQLKVRRHDDLEVLGELDINQSSVEDLVKMLHETSANSVILNAKHTVFGQIERVIHACEIEGVEAWLMADFFKTQISQTTFDDFYGRPVLVFRSAPEASWQGVCKQLLDLTTAFVMLVILVPLLFIPVALAIRLASPGPVLFKQRRCGLNGRPFTMLKFRSMVTDAEQRKQELAALNEMGGPVFKVTNDPRITPIGRWLRKYSIDEFPQLFNVLRGEMSLVGPRPLPVDEVQRFDDPSHRRRLSVKPGLTCLWQVSGRNQVKDFKDWVRLDLEYIDNWSFWLDLKILWRTIPVVLTGAGAK